MKDKKFNARQQSEQRDYTSAISGKIQLGKLTIAGNLAALSTELTHRGLPLLYSSDYNDTKKAGLELNFTDKKKALVEHEKGVRGQEKEFDPKEFFRRSPAIFNMHR